MENQELKTLILKEAGVFDKWDIENSLQLTENELNNKIAKLKKRKRLFIISHVILVLTALVLLISNVSQVFNTTSSTKNIFMIISAAVLAFSSFSLLDLRNQNKQEFIYSLLIKINKNQVV